MRTKLLTLLLCLLTTLPVLAYDFEVNSIGYNITGDNTVEVTRYDYDGYRGSITIPAEVQYDGKIYSVSYIGGNAFAGCTGLTSITLPTSITSIGEHAFYRCTGLTSITLPNSIKTIGNYAFSGCTGLTSITLPNSITYIGIEAFHRCTGLTSITLPNSITYIDDGAFTDCSSLTQIEVDNDNKAYCSIDGVLFNKDKTTIITYPAGKSNSNQYIIPNSVTYINNHAFYRCTGLTSITLPNSIKTIGRKAFEDCTGLTSITLPNSITSIGNYAFSGCTGLTSITLHNSIKTIGNETFYRCTGLTSITLPNSITSIGEAAFSGCTGLTSITLPNSITDIGGSAFSGCTGLTSITLPDSIKSIDNYAFEDCTGLTEIYCAAEVPPTCDYYTFYNVDYANCKLYVPTGAVEAYRTTDPWYKFRHIVGYDFAGVAEVSSVSPAVAYDLQGRRVSNPRRGIFIVNGQKQRLN